MEGVYLFIQVLSDNLGGVELSGVLSLLERDKELQELLGDVQVVQSTKIVLLPSKCEMTIVTL